MRDEKHANDDYVNPSPATAGPPVPPDVKPDELEAQLRRERGLDDDEPLASPAASGAEGSAPSSGDNGGGTPDPEPDPEPDAVDYSDTSKFSAADLEAEVDRRNAERGDDEQIAVDGSGANGDAIRADYEKALADDDARQAEEGPES